MVTIRRAKKKFFHKASKNQKLFNATKNDQKTIESENFRFE